MSNQTPTPPDQHELEHRREHEGVLERAAPGNRRIFLGVLAGGLTAGLFGLVGYLLLLGTEAVNGAGYLGSVIFLCLPFAAGFVTAMVARHKGILIASLILGVLFCFGPLLATGKEGLICVLMATPLIAVGLAGGALVGFLIRKYVVDKARHPKMLTMLFFLMAPLFLMGANSAEAPSRSPRSETIVSTMIVNASPEKVWQEIRSLDSLSSSKSYLMMIGLPVPQSCVIQGEGVGGKRICYFDQGYIEERITEWNPPKSMKLEITASTLPLGPWLGFQKASYEIRQENSKTVLTRSSTIISRLSPAWYWRRFERIGVETEHRYLFEEFRKRIDGK